MWRSARSSSGQIEKLLNEDVARPIIYHDRAATCWQPHVKGFVDAQEQHLQQLALRGRVARQVVRAGDIDERWRGITVAPPSCR